MADKGNFYKCYGKNAEYKYGTIIFWLIVWIILRISGNNSDSLVPYILALACLVPIFQVLSKRIHLEDNQVVIESWLFAKKYKYIPYDKVNDIEYKSFTRTIVIYTGNDKPIKFTWAEKPQEIIDYIQERAHK